MALLQPPALLALLAALLLGAVRVDAAELLQVRGAGVLQVGDRNRHYQVELACLAIPASSDAEASRWLRQQLPRGTRLNIRPLAADGENLVAHVSRLDRGQDLGEGLIAAGLAVAEPCPA